MKQYSRVCERVDLDAIFYNFQMMKANIKDGVQMIAVIKTDGYGHGAVQIGPVTGTGRLYLGATRLQHWTKLSS